MADKRLDVTQLDFDTIKSNLKIFLKNQDTFTDYDFEGSGTCRGIVKRYYTFS